jgi:tyrosyl-tRNA synthetase
VLLPGFNVHRNHEFVDAMDVPFFLTRLASRITVANMLSRDGFRKRADAGQPIALHEFLVPLIQGWDSVVVRAEVEIGGTDQLFNFQIARQLQEAEGQTPQQCLMTPVIRGTDGRKMSKSFNNAIWLDEKPAEMFGKIMSVSDNVAEEWLSLLTDLKDLPKHPMSRKKALAHNIVAQLHSEAEASSAQAHFEQTVQRKELPTELPTANQDTLFVMVAEARSESRSKARKLILGGGVKVDGEKVIDPLCTPSKGSTIRIGKRVAVKVV